LVVGSVAEIIGSAPTQLSVDWGAVDTLTITYDGPGGYLMVDDFVFA
jgi:hypothetical protein